MQAVTRLTAVAVLVAVHNQNVLLKTAASLKKEACLAVNQEINQNPTAVIHAAVTVKMAAAALLRAADLVDIVDLVDLVNLVNLVDLAQQNAKLNIVALELKRKKAKARKEIDNFKSIA